MSKDSSGRSEPASFLRSLYTELSLYTVLNIGFNYQTLGLPCRSMRQDLLWSQEYQVSIDGLLSSEANMPAQIPYPCALLPTLSRGRIDLYSGRERGRQDLLLGSTKQESCYAARRTSG